MPLRAHRFETLFPRSFDVISTLVLALLLVNRCVVGAMVRHLE